MKKGIHPNYNSDVIVNCICGNSFTIMSAVTWPIKVETCPKCHPTYTGTTETKVIKGQIEKFREKQKRMAEKIAAKKAA